MELMKEHYPHSENKIHRIESIFDTELDKGDVKK
jgi:hypothetical protein